MKDRVEDFGFTQISNVLDVAEHLEPINETVVRVVNK